jgi:hypothetical protein
VKLMTLKEVANLRLINQQIAVSEFHSPKELVSWMGAIQAQDLPMAIWAIGLRQEGSTDQMTRSAFDKGEIIRTHVLRPTWHLVAPEDIHWMLALTAPQVRTRLRTRHNGLGFTEAVIEKCIKVINESLEKNNHLERGELAKELEKIGITNDNNRLAHVLLYAEIEGLICSGELKGNYQSYTLLERRAARPEGISREEALEMLASRYFKSHGPATIQDFTWWSGLKTTDARIALEMAMSKLVPSAVGNKTYWSGPINTPAENFKDVVHLLPAYDEFLVSYSDRSAALPEIYNNKTVSNNGIFRPVIVCNGQVTGLWKKSMKPGSVEVEASLFRAVNKNIKDRIVSAAGRFGNFINKKTEVKFVKSMS